MELQQVLHMAGGEGDSSYATNSIVAKTVISKARPFLHRAIQQLISKTLPQCFTIAELGCSSGPNSLLVMSDIINTITTLIQNMGHPSPEFQVFLNDLPGNDFNTMFKFIPLFYDQLCKDERGNCPPCFVAGVPGTFYGRLFPKNSLSFVHSSTSVHWLSQVPRGIECNKGKIHVAKTSPPCVFEAYLKQFDTDFTLFLRSRSREIMSGGGMVITLIGRRSSNPASKECCQLWELLAKSLREMVALGLIEEAKLNTFNMPYYNPSAAELRNIIEVEGSFALDFLESFDVNWDANDNPESEDLVLNNITSGKSIAKCISAVTKSLVEDHFGKQIIEELFRRYAEHVSMQLMDENLKHVNLVMCMTKKC